MKKRDYCPPRCDNNYIVAHPLLAGSPKTEEYASSKKGTSTNWSEDASDPWQNAKTIADRGHYDPWATWEE